MAFPPWRSTTPPGEVSTATSDPATVADSAEWDGRHGRFKVAYGIAVAASSPPEPGCTGVPELDSRAVRQAADSTPVEFGKPGVGEAPGRWRDHPWAAAGRGFLAHLCDLETTVGMAAPPLRLPVRIYSVTVCERTKGVIIRTGKPSSSGISRGDGGDIPLSGHIAQVEFVSPPEGSEINPGQDVVIAGSTKDGPWSVTDEGVGNPCTIMILYRSHPKVALFFRV
jgi:hypothetical protein